MLSLGLVVVLVLLNSGLHCEAYNDYYTAGVVEFRPAMFGASSEQLLEENLNAYLELIAKANGITDILVFPEATLNSALQLTAVPEIDSERSLCENDTDVANFLHQLACAARQAHTYLVINVKERENCDQQVDASCPTRGYNLYNTNVVFNRKGAIVSRYRKWNLYLEPLTNRTKEPEYAIFETDFNVTFGHFICFDMLFYTPAQELVERLGIRDVIVTKLFNSELPFLTASQLQQGWAWGNNVNLLAAGASLPQGAITGSGIYAGQQGALVRLMVADQTEGQRTLLLAQVPRWPALKPPTEPSKEQPAQRLLPLGQDPQMENFTSYLLPLFNGSSVSGKLCQMDLCCEFDIGLQLDGKLQPQYQYRMGVFVGQRRYEEAKYSFVRICGIFACRNASLSTCGLLSEEHTPERGTVEFTSLRISGEFVSGGRHLIMPSTLNSALYALQPTELVWSMEERETVTWTQLELKQSHKQLLTFGIYGNYFEETDEGSNEASSSLGMGCLWLLVLPLMRWVG